jgi:predicted kinase
MEINLLISFFFVIFALYTIFIYKMEKALFKSNNGTVGIYCSKCGRLIKTAPNFNTMEKYAFNGVTSLLAQYCDEHKYLSMSGNEKKREMIRRGIKEKLREGIMTKNILNIDITRPDQELVIMRGIPGSGKSTEANSLVGEGIIHSTDTLIEATGDYNGYFAKMVESGNWSEHGRMHNRNFLNAKASMEEGVSPVVVDNTNIKASEPKKYVEAALKLGFDENNIRIVDVADGNQTVEVLAERNTHNVPLKTIKRMLTSHRGVGPLTVEKILESKGGLKNSSNDKVLYSAVVIDDKSKTELLRRFREAIPADWKVIAHHMTIVFGKGLDDKNEIGKSVNLTATEVGFGDLVMAVKVDGYPSANDIPHITVAVDVAGGGKAFFSNKITDWTPLSKPINLRGVVQEIKP